MRSSSSPRAAAMMPCGMQAKSANAVIVPAALARKTREFPQHTEPQHHPDSANDVSPIRLTLAVNANLNAAGRSELLHSSRICTLHPDAKADRHLSATFAVMD